jgi:CRP-like cAMP-binding protein
MLCVQTNTILFTMATLHSEIDVRALLQSTVFGRLGDTALDEVVRFARIERYTTTTLLNAEGQSLEWLRLVVQGHIEILMRNASGKEVSISNIGPGGWATWLPCFMPTAPITNLYSSESSCYIALPVSRVRDFCDRHPTIFPLILAEVGQRMYLLLAWTGQSVMSGPEQRMAKLIHVLAREQKVAQTGGSLNVTQGRLASLARCSRQSANTLLGALEKRQLIRLAYGKCDIPDMALLAKFADDDVQA